MDRIWQWVWHRYGARYSWALYAAVVAMTLPIYLFWSLLIVAVARSSVYVEASVHPPGIDLRRQRPEIHGYYLLANWSSHKHGEALHGGVEITTQATA